MPHKTAAPGLPALLTRALLAVEHGLWGGVMFVAALPVLTTAIPGSTPSPWQRRWRAAWDGAQAGYSRFKLQQLRALRRLGMIDAPYAGAVLDEHLPRLAAADPAHVDEVNRIVSLHREGTINTATAAGFMARQTARQEFMRQYNLLGHIPAAQRADMDKAWFTALGWADMCAAGMGAVGADERAATAIHVAHIFRHAARGGHPPSGVTMACNPDSGALCLLFGGNAERLTVYETAHDGPFVGALDTVARDVATLPPPADDRLVADRALLAGFLGRQGAPRP